MSKIRVNEITDLNDNLLWSASEGVGGAPVSTSSGDQTLNEALQSRVIYVDTIADLQALDTNALVEGQQVHVKEYHAGTGVGGGEFYWDAASTDADNGGTVFAVSDVATGRWKRVFKSVRLVDFGAKPFTSDDVVQAMGAALSYLNSSDFDTLYAEGRFVFSGKVGQVGFGKTIKGGDFTASGDVDGFIHVGDGACLDGLHIDFSGHQVTGRYGVTTEPTATIKHCEIHGIYNLEGTSTEAYLIRSSIGPGQLRLIDNDLYDVSNTGDNVLTVFGFAGHVLVIGDPLPLGDEMEVIISGSRHSKARTVFLDGATYQQKLNDNDADSIRVFVEGSPSEDHYKQLTIVSENNHFKECQKRIYKINDATLLIKNDSSSSPVLESGIPGMDSLMQLMRARAEVYNSNYHINSRRHIFSAQSAYGTKSNELPVIIKNVRIRNTRTEIDTLDSTSVVLFYDVLSNANWEFENISLSGIDMIINSATTEMPYFSIDGLSMEGGYSLVNYDHGGINRGYRIANATCVFNPVNLSNRGRSISDTGDVSAAGQLGGHLHNVYIEDPVDRTEQAGASPYVVNCTANNLRIDGLTYKCTNNTSRNRIRFMGGSGMVLSGINTNDAIQIDGTTDCLLMHSSAKSVIEGTNTNLRQSFVTEIDVLS